VPQTLTELRLQMDETAGLAERAMMLSAAHSKCKLRRQPMKKSIREENRSEAETGSDRRVDLGDRFSHYGVLNGDGES